MLTIASDLVPLNYKGKPSDLEFSTRLPSWQAAHHLFQQAMQRLLDPGKWRELSGWASADFVLVEPLTGINSNGAAIPGHFIRIDIPGPGPREGHGYDWVIIDTIEDRLDPVGPLEWIAMKVHPCPESGKTGAAAHFFDSEASSTFILQRDGDNVMSSYHGRNETANTSSGRSLDNLRNAVVAAGAMLSFSEVQWSALCKAFIAVPDPSGR